MKKTFSLIGMIGGVLAIVLGVLILAGVFGGDGNTPGSAPYGYDSGYSIFGADFYTYVSNNAAEAASAGRAAAYNTRDLIGLTRYVGGGGLIAFGLFMLCSFGIKFAEEKNGVVKIRQEQKADLESQLPEI